MTKSDSGIPKIIIDYFGSREAYHQYKQKNWQQIENAFVSAHGKKPGTTGAQFTIDAKTAKELIKFLEQQNK